MAGKVNNISRSFADNVNYLAELDNQYYRTGFIKRNGINIDGSIHRGIVKLNVFDLTSKEHKNTEIYSADINGNSDLINFFNNMKNTIIGLYPDVSINVSVVDGTNIISDKNIDIQISSTDTILGQITVSIHQYILGDIVETPKYTLTSGSDNYIAVLPYLSQLDDSFNNAILTIGENSNSIKTVSDNIDNVNAVGNSISNVNINALNINSINTNASNIANINNLGSRAEDIDSIISNVIPNLAEILLADDNAIIATTKASEANASASSALSSKNSASASEVNAFSYMNSASQYKDNALTSANNALLSEQNAASSETNASNSELNASISESNALIYRNETEAMKLAVETIYDTFDDRFLGVFNSDPILDNDGNVLNSGALYFNPISHELKVYDVGTAIWYPLPQVYLSALLDVELTSISTNNVLIWNGTKWTNSNLKTINGLSLIGAGDLSISAGGGYAANVYLTTIQSTTNGSYSQLSYTPEVAETILSATANNNTVLIEDYIFDGDVQAQFIPAGEWGFHFHRKVDNTAGDTKIIFEMYKRSNTGVETVLFTASSLSIEDTSFTREDLLITKPSFVVNTTDRVGLKVYATTTRTSNVTVQLKIGDGEACYFNTPLAIRHNQLRARDEADSHTIGSITGLQTSLDNKVDDSEKGSANGVATLNVATLVPTTQLGTGIADGTKVLKGDSTWGSSTGTGNVVFSTSPVLTTPNIGVATGTSFNSITGLASVAPLVAGNAAVGTSTLAARQDHVHPVQTTVSGNAGTATALQTARTISLIGDITGSATFDGTANASITATIAANSVALGTDTTGNYVAGLTQGTGITISGTAGEGWSPTVSIANVGTAGTYTKVTTNAQGQVTSGTTLSATDIPALDASKITTGTIDVARLPSFVDDVLEYVNLAGFPLTGETGKIYVALDTNKTYRWSGSTYVYITSGAVDSVAGKTGVVTLVKSDVGLSLVDNTADSSKNVLSATKLTTARTITLSGDVAGSVSFDGSANATIATTVQPNSVALGTDTTGNYVAGATAGTGISISGTAGEGWSPTITNTAPNVTTDISVTHDVSSVVVNSSDGLDGTINAASQTLAGVMTAADKTKLDGIASGATGSATITAGTGLTGGGTGDVTLNVNGGKGILVTADNVYLNGSEIPSGVNLNTYRTTGIYCQNANADTSLALNYPIAVAGILQVWNDDYGNGLHTVQLYSIYNTSQIFHRTYYNGAWSSWRDLTLDTTYSNATTSVSGLMSNTDKTKLDGIATGATANTGTVTSIATTGAITGGTITTTGTISHSTADGYLHVPATGTTNNGKVLTAGATAGSLSWTTIPSAPVTSVAGKTGDVTLAIGDISNLQTTLDTRIEKVTSTDNAIVRFNGTGGAVQNSGVYIDDNSHIGIGTATPTDGVIHLNKSGATNSNIKFTNGTTGATATDGFFVGIGTDGKSYVYQRENLDLLFGTNNTTRMTLTAAGVLDVPLGFSGVGTSLTALNASNLASGTIPDARISGSYTGITNLTGSGTVDFAKFLGNAADTVTTPSFSWTGDDNTGIYSPGADQVAITTGGVQRALFNSSGITGTLVGNASTATTLQTARTIQTNLASTTSASFNGSANISPGVTGVLGVVNGGTGSSTVSGATVFAGPVANTSAPANAAPSFRNLELTDIPGSAFKKSVRCATTAALTLNAATATIDGVTLAATDRVLIKNQATASQNGIYYNVTTTTWVRTVDSDVASEIASAVVAVDEGTVNGGKLFTTTFKPTDTLGTTAMNWFEVLDDSKLLTSGSASVGAVGYNGTTATAGKFDGGTTTPTGSTRLNYGGYFYPTYLNLVGSADTATAATHYYVETGSDGYVRPKTLANVKAELLASAALTGTPTAPTAATTVSTTQVATTAFATPRTGTTGSAVIPSGTTAQRDGTPLNGYIRYNTTLNSFEGYVNGTWGNIGGGSGGAVGGGSDKVFYENDQVVTTSYSITAGKNAMSAGDVTINTEVTVTVPTGSRWVII